MKIPRSFKIKGRTWTVKYVKNLLEEGEKCNGLATTDDALIQIDKDLDDDCKSWVFWHEYCHAFLHELNLTGSSKAVTELVEEILCDGFADVMNQDDKIIQFRSTRRKK